MKSQNKTKQKVKRITLLLFVVFPVIFFSCLSEDTDGCAARRNLKFSYSSMYASGSNFDNTIGNDVILCLYQDNKLRYTEQISYDRIVDDRIYSYKKRYGGDIDIVAWAVKAGSPDRVPDLNIGEDMNDKYVMAKADSYPSSSKPFANDLYLGVISIKNDDITNETTHEIVMKNPACKVEVVVDDPGGILSGTGRELSVRIDGVMNKMNMRFEGIGDETSVYKTLIEDASAGSVYTTGYFSILPSSENQTVKATLYHGNDRVVVVETGERAMSGGRIIIRIVVGTSVIVDINGWELRNVGVEWM